MWGRTETSRGAESGPQVCESGNSSHVLGRLEKSLCVYMHMDTPGWDCFCYFLTPLFTVEDFDPQEAVRCLAVFSQLELASPEIPHACRETWSAVGGQVESHGETSCEGREQGRPGSRTLLWVKAIQPMICEVLGAAFWKPETPKGLFVPAGQRPVPSLQQPGPPLHLFAP